MAFDGKLSPEEQAKVQRLRDDLLIELFPAINCQMEQWKPVFGYEGHYEVSNLGNVRSLDHPDRRQRGKMLAPGISNGYPRVCLCRDGAVKMFAVHRLVAFAFLGEPTADRPMVNHKNGLTTDARPENLEWCNASENLLHNYALTGRKSGGRGPVGAKCGQAKLNDDAVRLVREMLPHISCAKIAAQFGVSSGAIQQIATGRTWKHV
jgi:hypothetical protein